MLCECMFRIGRENDHPPNEQSPDKNMNKKVAGYTYDSSRSLNALVPKEVEKGEVKEVKVSDAVVIKVREARGDESWKESEVRILREAAKLEVVHYYRKLKQLKEKTEVHSEDRRKVNKLLREVGGIRNDLVFEVMLGRSVVEVFREYCDEINTRGLLFEDSEVPHAL